MTPAVAPRDARRPRGRGPPAGTSRFHGTRAPARFLQRSAREESTMTEPQAYDRERYPLCLDNPRHVHVFSCPQPGPMEPWRARLECESASHVPDGHCGCSMRRRDAGAVDRAPQPTS
jgi:hypothetical protein